MLKMNSNAQFDRITGITV